MNTKITEILLVEYLSYELEIFSSEHPVPVKAPEDSRDLREWKNNVSRETLNCLQ